MKERVERNSLIILKYVFDLIRGVAVRTQIQKNLDADFLDTQTGSPRLDGLA